MKIVAVYLDPETGAPLKEGYSFWDALIYYVPDTIFLTRDERRTLLEKITMKERDEKRMKNWVFG